MSVQKLYILLTLHILNLRFLPTYVFGACKSSVCAMFLHELLIILTAVCIDFMNNYTFFQATSKLLVNYPEKERNEILDYLFKVCNFYALLQTTQAYIMAQGFLF